MLLGGSTEGSGKFGSVRGKFRFVDMAGLTTIESHAILARSDCKHGLLRKFMRQLACAIANTHRLVKPALRQRGANPADDVQVGAQKSPKCATKNDFCDANAAKYVF